MALFVRIIVEMIKTDVAIAHVFGCPVGRPVQTVVGLANFVRLLPLDNLLRYLVEGFAYVDVILCRRKGELNRDVVLGLLLSNPELHLFS